MNKHFSELFKVKSTPTPWSHMILCGLATISPIVIGLLQRNVAISVYAAIIGYLVALNDHFGVLKHRLIVANLTYLLLLSGFSLGIFLKPGAAYFVVFTGVVYWLGVLAGQGAELERAVLFSVTAMVIARSAPRIQPEVLPTLGLYIAVGYLILMAGIPALALLQNRSIKPFKGLTESFRKSLTRRTENHIHAVSYALTVLFSIFCARHLRIERGYWVTVTVLLVMKPDRTLSIYTTFQRLVGTLAGVLIAESVIQACDHVTIFALGVMLCASAVPWAMEKNYAFVAFFVTIMVVFLLEMTLRQPSDTHLPFVRLQATAIGCGLSLVGTLISKSLDSLWLSSRRP